MKIGRDAKPDPDSTSTGPPPVPPAGSELPGERSGEGDLQLHHPRHPLWMFRDRVLQPRCAGIVCVHWHDLREGSEIDIAPLLRFVPAIGSSSIGAGIGFISSFAARELHAAHLSYRRWRRNRQSDSGRIRRTRRTSTASTADVREPSRSAQRAAASTFKPISHHAGRRRCSICLAARRSGCRRSASRR